MSTRLSRAHFALTSGDGWSLELACLGMPQIVLAQEERHLSNGQRLEEEGAATTVAGLGEKTYQGKRGYPVVVDADVDQVDAAVFDGLVIPGGFAPDQLRRSDKVLRLTREIYQAGKPLALSVQPSACLERNRAGPTKSRRIRVGIESVRTARAVGRR